MWWKIQNRYSYGVGVGDKRKVGNEQKQWKH